MCAIVRKLLIQEVEWEKMNGLFAFLDYSVAFGKAPGISPSR